MRKIKVGIIGHTGRLGKPLIEILRKHPAVEITYTESRSDGCRGSLSEAETVFLALPYGESLNHLSKLKNKRVIDLSIDHRGDDDWTYGLPEIFGNEIKNARLIANPGCYATSIILALYPIKDKIKSIRVSSTSGISGAGIAQEKEENFLVYKEGDQHPQIQEIKRILGVTDVLFVPQRIDSTERGIISTIFVNAKDRISDAQNIYRTYYRDCRFIKICDKIETKQVIGTNFCDIKIMGFEKDILIVSALDNILKGGAGQAVQNFNLMNGLPDLT